MMLLMLLIARLLPDFNLWLAPEEVGRTNRVWVDSSAEFCLLLFKAPTGTKSSKASAFFVVPFRLDVMCVKKFGKKAYFWFSFFPKKM
jgi:hypothetical protein